MIWANLNVNWPVRNYVFKVVGQYFASYVDSAGKFCDFLALNVGYYVGEAISTIHNQTT